MPLTPLTASDIGAHFRGIFPQVSLPEDFEKSLGQITQGNPLFLCEIQRKLVLEGKLTLTGQQWVVESLDEGYLPKSLEEIVSQKIVALDKESKELLDQASTFGENVSLSLLTGSSENRETQVLEFVDQAVAQGLISIDYQMNDDTIRFLGKRVLEITYGAIDEDRKRELHERIGDYQETLYEQKLLPSAATLAYHFQRSANQEKARLYLESQQTLNNKIFNSAEAVHYTGEKLEDTVPEDTPLDSTSLSDIPGVIRALLTTVRNIKLYPPGSKAIVTSTEQLRAVIDKILTNNERLNITVVENDLVVNGETLDIEEFKSIAQAFMKFLTQVELRGIALSRGLAGHELRAMVEGLGRSTKKMIDRRFWKRFAAEQRLYHIDLKQVRYTTMTGPDDAPEDRGAGQPESIDAPGYDRARILGIDQPLDDHEVNQIPDVLRCLLTASSNIKLYPPESTAIRYSIEQLYRALKGFLSNRPALTLARVGESLLINGQRIDTGDFKTMADGFLRFLESINLRSLSFLRDISVRELVAFISAAGRSTADSLDTFFWRRLAREQQLFTILFDQRLYGILGERVGIGADHLEKAEEISEEEDLGPGQAVVPGVHPEVAPTVSGVPPADYTSQESTIPEPSEFRLTDRSLDAMAEKLSDTLLKGDEKQTLQIMHQLFQDFGSQGNFIRTKVINMCENFLEDPVYGSQPTLVEFFIDPLLRAFPQEEDLGLARQIGALLSQTAANLIQFGDYQMASRILTHLRSRQNQLQAKRKNLSEETIFLRELDPKIQMTLLEDLRSKDPAWLQRVTQLLSTLGPVAIPLLVEVIKGEDSLRLRQIASYLLKSLGPEAAKLLKRELVLEGFHKERVRILEVIDGVTQDLKTELAYTLGDDNPKVRRTAFHLAERLNDAQATSLLFDYANHEDPKMAIIAIKSLGKIKPAGTVDFLLSLLESSKEVERLIACCRALGQLADPAAIEPLAKILSPGSILSLRKRRSSAIRAAAAYALAQIPHTRVSEVLAPYADDRDPRVRQIARSRVTD